ncbi:cytochrome P450 [Desemzia sp. RIT804]|uniref:cytochrome P450 n=1 Tax=Desemzia sp. RIT 804 TaxID=2810209 RepID=UPI00195206AC|nr:cytochrome P450 [Desemzia sp. RIT 804]MBM6615815.1 cytochrome P450 [Desemzia sp. RIT 804]
MSHLSQMPKEEGLDHSLSVLKEGYPYFLKRREEMDTDVFETTVLGQKTYCLGGEAGAELFYDTSRFKRSNAMPKPVQKVLTGEHGIQSLDGEEHEDRKKMFMSLMSPAELERLTDLLEKHWLQSAEKWEAMEQVILYEEVKEILCRTACEWAGVPLLEEEIEEVTQGLANLFEKTASISPAYLQGARSRKKLEKWIEKLVQQVRNRELSPEENTALYVFSWHRDNKGKLMEEDVAAVEILNIIRPIVAIAIYIAFTAQAVIQYPAEAKKLTTQKPKQYQYFVQEVRRFYPFFPFQAALTKKDFSWNGYEFKKDTLTILDIYGTNHDSKIWEDPDQFSPDRFSDWKESPFSFIPQGGGNHLGGHRCAGEWITIKVMKVCLDYLVNQLSFSVPEQDLSFNLTKFPTIPNSKIVLSRVRLNNK